MQTHNFGNIDGIDAVDGAVGETGDTGKSGVGFAYRGDWVAGGSYENGDYIDIVKYQSNLYYCKKSTNRSNAPDHDAQTWVVFSQSGNDVILHCSFAAEDWVDEYDETANRFFRIATAEFDGIRIPSKAKYFLWIDPTIRRTYGIEVSAVGESSITFRATSAVAVDIDFCYKDIPESYVDMLEERAKDYTEIKIELNQTTSPYFGLRTYNHDNFQIDWGDGTIDGSRGHEYDSFGKYTVRIKGSIGGSQGAFSDGAPFDRAVRSVKFNADALREHGLNYCLNLKSVTFSGLERNIPSHAFTGCISLGDIKIPDGVLWIGESAFWNCYEMKKVTLPDSLRTIYEEAFGNCKIDEINLPNVLDIKREAFHRAHVRDIEITENMNLEDYSFSDCGFSSLSFKQGVNRINGLAFYRAHCSELNLPTSVSEIIEPSFMPTAYMINYAGTMSQFYSITGAYHLTFLADVIHCTDGDIECQS